MKFASDCILFRNHDVSNFEQLAAVHIMHAELKHIKLVDAPGAKGMTCQGVQGTQEDVDVGFLSSSCQFGNIPAPARLFVK